MPHLPLHQGVLLTAASLVALSACSGATIVPPEGAPPSAPPPLAPSAITESTLLAPSYPGISGIALADDGRILAVPERNPVLLTISMATSSPEVVGTPLSIPGQDGSIDLESLTLMGDGRLAIGTESTTPYRASDPIFFYRLEAAALVADGHIDLPYTLWDTRAESNRGIEGLCHAGGVLVAAAETALEGKGGPRFALLATLHDGADTWMPYRLWLSSQEGKISSLDCWETELALEVIAIERHFGVIRLLRFTLPLGNTPAPGTTLDIVPEVIADLSQVRGEIPNMEGLIRSGDGGLLLVSDNAHGEASGPAYFWSLTIDQGEGP